FADIRTVMAEMGKAMMGTGEAEGENRAARAAEAAINNPLLEDTSMSGAKGLLINITGGEDMTLFEVDQAMNRIREEVDEEANILFGSAIDGNANGRMRVSVVATGIDRQQAERPRLIAVGGGLAVEALGGDQSFLAHAVTQGHDSGATRPQPGSRPLGLPPLGHPSGGFSPVSVPSPVPGPAPGQVVHPAMQSAEQRPLGLVQPFPAAQPLPALPGQPASAPAPEIGPQFGQPTPRQPMGTLPKTGLFTAPQAMSAPGPAPEPARATIFRKVTGALLGLPAAAPSPAATREPPPEEGPTAKVRLAASEDFGFDIPAFLRKQSS
ncbi:MAG: cell division protein FtsZ, partial [Acetobacteraceae bacterium]